MIKTHKRFTHTHMHTHTHTPKTKKLLIGQKTCVIFWLWSKADQGTYRTHPQQKSKADPETMTHLTHITLTASRNSDPSYSHYTHCIQKQWPILHYTHCIQKQWPILLTPLTASGNNDPSYTLPSLCSRVRLIRKHLPILHKHSHSPHLLQ